MPTCFVVMGFGEKTDLASGRKLNLDMSYRNVIKPAIEAEGYTCVRADEIQHSGMIDIPMYDMLYRADLVVADLSTSNLNAVFELGVRHALKPRSTIIVAETHFVSPFDVNHIIIRRYEHLGPDIGYAEVIRMQKELRALVRALKMNQQPDSPIYSLIPWLKPPSGSPPETEIVAAPLAEALGTSSPEDSYAAQLNEALMHKANSEFDKARAKLLEIYEAQSAPSGSGRVRMARPRIIQELAFATYQAGDKADAAGGTLRREAAYQEAINVLLQLDPEQTTDPETLGLWSAVHKRRADLSTRTGEQRRADLDTAIHSSERGFFIRQDYYNGTNLAYLLDLRATLTSGNDKIADLVHAARIRERVAAIARQRLAELTSTTQDAPADLTRGFDLRAETYWVCASLAEALIGLGKPEGQQILENAKLRAPEPWMIEASDRQIAKLRTLRPMSS